MMIARFLLLASFTLLVGEGRFRRILLTGDPTINSSGKTFRVCQTQLQNMEPYLLFKQNTPPPILKKTSPLKFIAFLRRKNHGLEFILMKD